MSAKRKPVYRIMFFNQGQVYEIYARSISHGGMLGFVEVGEIVFGQKTQVVVDPAEERLKTEFSGVTRTYIPIHTVIRIDEVDKEGSSTIREVGEGASVTPFPMPVYSPGSDKGGKS